MPLALDRRIADEITRLLCRREVGNPQGVPSEQWKAAMNEMTMEFTHWQFKAKAKDKEARYWEQLGKLVALKHQKVPLRCADFAGAVVYLLTLNRNFESNIRLVRAGAARGNNHFFVVCHFDSSPTFNGAQPTTWGGDAFVVDAWRGAQKGLGPAVRPPAEVHQDDLPVTPLCDWPARA